MPCKMLLIRKGSLQLSINGFSLLHNSYLSGSSVKPRTAKSLTINNQPLTIVFYDQRLIRQSEKKDGRHHVFLKKRPRQHQYWQS